jgi:hypothetical protein
MFFMGRSPLDAGLAGATGIVFAQGDGQAAALLYALVAGLNSRRPSGFGASGNNVRISIVFVISRWISILGRVAAIAIAIGILVRALLHLGNPNWSEHGWWPLYYLFLFMYWLPVEIAGQILMALGRRLRPAGKSGA